jgi:hypothetical protein
MRYAVFFLGVGLGMVLWAQSAHEKEATPSQRQEQAEEVSPFYRKRGRTEEERKDVPSSIDPAVGRVAHSPQKGKAKAYPQPDAGIDPTLGRRGSRSSSPKE